MVAFLAGVSGLAAAWPVVAESKQGPEPVLIPLPRGTERTVMAPCRRSGLVMTSPVQEVRIRVNVSLGVVKRTVLSLTRQGLPNLSYHQLENRHLRVINYQW